MCLNGPLSVNFDSIYNGSSGKLVVESCRVRLISCSLLDGTSLPSLGRQRISMTLLLDSYSSWVTGLKA